MKTVRIDCAVSHVKKVAIAIALLGWLVSSAATTAWSQNGWAVGNGGMIIGTTNGGGQWIPERSGVTVKLNSVSALPDGSVAWAVGDTGGDPVSSTFLQGTRQANGAVAWAPAAGRIPVLANLNGVFFVDATHGWAVGDVAGRGNTRASTILRFDSTTNTWAQEFPRQTQDPRSPMVRQKLNSVYFITKKTNKGTQYFGWAVGNSGTILFYNNGSWTAVNLPAAAANLNFTSVSVWSANNREREGTAKNALANDHVVIYVGTNTPGQVWFSDSYFYKGQVWGPMKDRAKNTIEAGTTINTVGAGSIGSCWFGQAPTPPANRNVQYIASEGQRGWQAPVDKTYATFGAVSGLAVTQDAPHSEFARHIWIVGPEGKIAYRNDTVKNATWTTQYTPGRGQGQPLNAIVMMGTGGPGGLVRLEDSTSPDSAAAGMNYVSLTGSGFPEGNITPGNVVVALATQCRGSAGTSTSAVSVVSASSDSNLISFLLPSGLAPGQYFVSISDSEEGDANFESSNCSVVNIAQ